MPETLHKAGILRGRTLFHKLFTEGKTLTAGAIRCFYSVSEDVPGVVQAGFAVSRSAKRAVTRNRIKRLMRESWRRRQEKIRPGKKGLQVAFLFYKYSGERTIKLHEIDNTMFQLIEKLSKLLP